MKVKVSKKDVLKGCSRVFKVGYCQLDNLLSDKTPIMYSCGQDGWSCDYYVFEEFNLIISTGYRPIGQDIDYKLVKEYDQKAREVSDVKELQKEFIRKVLGK